MIEWEPVCPTCQVAVQVRIIYRDNEQGLAEVKSFVNPSEFPTSGNRRLNRVPGDIFLMRPARHLSHKHQIVLMGFKREVILSRDFHVLFKNISETVELPNYVIW